MSVTAVETFLLPAVAGLFFAIIGIAYQMGRKRGLTPLEILGSCSVLGVVAFSASLIGSGASLADMPVSLWVWGLVAAVSQYAAVRLFGTALQLGPMAPVWCVMSLNFVPTMIYSAVFLAENLAPVQYAAVVVSVFCVLVASMQSQPSEEKSTGQGRSPADASRELAADGLESAAVVVADVESREKRSWRRQGLYLVILTTIFVLAGLMPISMRDVGAQQGTLSPLMHTQRSHFLLLLCYIGLILCMVAEKCVTRQSVASIKALAALGFLAGIGSVGGLVVLSRCATSGIAFAVTGIVQILAIAVLGVAVFGEKPSASWYATIILGVSAVFLANWRQIVGG